MKQSMIFVMRYPVMPYGTWCYLNFPAETDGQVTYEFVKHVEGRAKEFHPQFDLETHNIIYLRGDN